MCLELGIYIRHEISGKCAETMKKLIDGFKNITYYPRLKDIDFVDTDIAIQIWFKLTRFMVDFCVCVEFVFMGSKNG